MLPAASKVNGLTFPPPATKTPTLKCEKFQFQHHDQLHIKDL
jgi:hypothetical protein